MSVPYFHPQPIRVTPPHKCNHSNRCSSSKSASPWVLIFHQRGNKINHAAAPLKVISRSSHNHSAHTQQRATHFFYPISIIIILVHAVHFISFHFISFPLHFIIFLSYCILMSLY